MRILQVSHFYPPEGFAGVEVYTRSLAGALHERGHDVRLVCATGWTQGPKHFNGIVEDSVDGILVQRLALNWTKAPRPADYLYRNPVVADQFRRFLDDWRPDVLHVQSCYSLSGSVIEVAHSLGIPIVLHLHDFWFICPRHTLLRWNGEVCSGIVTADDCQRCMLGDAKAYRYPRSALSESNAVRVAGGLARIGPATRWPGLRGMVGRYDLRQSYLGQILQNIAIVICPSEFMQTVHKNAGVPEDRMRIIRHGSQAPQERCRQIVSPVRRIKVGFMGNISPIKGVHILVQAFQQLQMDTFELHIHGPLNNEAYVSDVYARAAENTNVYFHGAYNHDDVGSILANVHVLVVPSLWYENSPFVIREALANGVPVIVSGHGALPEMVTHNVNGLHFKPGDANDLAIQLRRLSEEPDLLPTLVAGIRPLKPFAEEVVEVVAIYRDLQHSRLAPHYAH